MSQLALNTPIIPFDDIERMANVIAKSQLFGVKNKDHALALMLISQAEGRHPAIAARDYHLIEGRATLTSDAMLARFQQAGGKVEWPELSDTRVAGIFSHAKGGKVEIVWTMEMAARAGLSTKAQRDGKPNMYHKFPRQMLRSRVVSEGIRTVFPGVIVGTYTPEEAYDMEPVRVVAIPRDPEAKGLPEPDPVTEGLFTEVQAEVVTDTAPDATPPHQLDSVFQGRDLAGITAFLISKRELAEGQTYRDLTPTFSQFIADNQDRFFQAVAKHAATTAN